MLEDVVPALGNMLVVVAVSFSAKALLMVLEKQLKNEVGLEIDMVEFIK